jgi:S1-C subfamily serine protease
VAPEQRFAALGRFGFDVAEQTQANVLSQQMETQMLKRWGWLGLFLGALAIHGAVPGAVQTSEIGCPEEDDEKVVYESDRSIRMAFQKRLLEFKEAGAFTDPETLREQLGRTQRVRVDLPEAATDEKSASGIYRDHKRSVVAVGNLYLCDKCDKEHFSCATGFVVSTNGIVATNYHVIETEGRIILGVMTADGSVHGVMETLAADKAGDVALIRINAEGLTALPLATDEPVGSEVSVISHPSGRFYSMTQGIISRYTRKTNHGASVLEMEITADFARGSSGGPVFNDRGHVVGMVKSTNNIYYSREEGVDSKPQMVIKNCVPAETILGLIQK